MRMSALDHQTRITLALNVEYLMDHQPGDPWVQTKLASESGMSQTSISNLLDAEGQHSPTIRTAEAVARAFGLSLWHLFLPTLIEDLNSDTSIHAIYLAYQKSTPEGRRHIQRIAEREAEFNVSGSAS